MALRAKGRDALVTPESAVTAGGGLAADPRRGLWILFAVAGGLAVANISLADPLLVTIADEFAVSRTVAGLIVTATQIGYGAGLILIVPLGDLIDRRRLIVSLMIASGLALLVVARAPSFGALLAAVTGVGLLAVLTQLLVAHAALLAGPAARGRVVGIVTSGVITGILSARAISGALADLLGWRAVYLVSGGATLVMSAVLLAATPRQQRLGAAMPYPRLVGSLGRLLMEERRLRSRGALAFLTFGANAMLWASLALPLRAPPFSLSHLEIGLFGLAGVTGAFGAMLSGRLADRGMAQRATSIGLGAMLLSWLPIWGLPLSLWSLGFGILLIAFGLQTVHVTSQALILARRPEAQSRLVAVYMVFYAAGSAAGAILATLAHAHAGWSGVCLAGALTSLAGLLLWLLVDRRQQAPDAGA